MRKKLGRVLILLLWAELVFSQASSKSLLPLANPGSSLLSGPAVQEFPPQKPKYDYMSSFYSRNTKPLGLKEDVALRRLMRQPGIKWAIRSGLGHILN